MQEQADHVVLAEQSPARAEAEALRARVMAAVRTIKSSRIGQRRGREALYEVPWCLLIGPPAAGKTSAILNSGLQFPFQDGPLDPATANTFPATTSCDWYFTSTGIVIDSAGRYALGSNDRSEWLSFLGLLKKVRSRAPINACIVAVSIQQLTDSSAEAVIELARTLRQRLQEIAERLEVMAPVYVLFTQADRIAGFGEFFQHLDSAGRELAWGCSLAYDSTSQSSPEQAFNRGFDELLAGLREMGLAQLAMQRAAEVPVGLLTLPLEFAGLKPQLSRFITSLFEDNPYQFRPWFRGFHFSSACQHGPVLHPASARVAQAFDLQIQQRWAETADVADRAYFLKQFFQQVVFADQHLVKQTQSAYRNRLRQWVFAGSVLMLALAAGLWTWSTSNNLQLVENVRRDLQQAVQLQQGRLDLKSRIDALLLLQERLQQLQDRHAHRWLTAHPGIYQRSNIERQLKAEYYQGMRQLMLEPVTANLEAFLAQVVAHSAELGQPPLPQQSPQQSQQAQTQNEQVRYQQASPSRSEDGYNALKAYLMLGNRQRAEGSHLAQQLTLFWRDWLDANRGQMSREEMLRAGEKLMSYYVAHADDAQWPQIQPQLALVNDSRQALALAMKGEPALQRVYAQIKARAAARFPTITADALIGHEQNGDAISGSYAISGAFSRQAWQDYVQAAINSAASTQLLTSDWVLGTREHSDLSLAGSPEHVAAELAALYKQEYVQQWQRFLAGLGVAPFQDFEQAVQQMNRIGDPANSPLKLLLDNINQQTRWDNPLAEVRSQTAKTGFVAWFKRSILRRDPEAEARQLPIGPISKAFAGLDRLSTPQPDQPALLDGYFQLLAKLRTRLNSINNQSDIGDGTRQLMQETFSNQGSELSRAQALLDEQVLTGLDEAQRTALRRLLLRPLSQTFAALVPPTEAEINRSWSAQVYQPFNTGIGRQYPFNLQADVDAAGSDIAAIFGSNGAVVSFNKQALGSLVIQRGSLLEARRWLGQGIRLSSELVANYGNWVSGQGGDDADAPAYIFQITPAPAIGAVEYTVQIDGQVLRYRNTPPQPMTMQYPNPDGPAGARITALSADGSHVTVFDSPGSQGLSQLIEAAETQRLDETLFNMSWSSGNISVPVQMRIVQSPGQQTGASSDWQRGLRLPATIVGGNPDESRSEVAAKTVVAGYQRDLGTGIGANVSSASSHTLQ